MLVTIRRICMRCLLGVRFGIICAGGMVFARLAIRRLRGPLERIARLLHTNAESVIGLLLNCFQSIAIVPLFPSMDRRGQLLNAAFAVCGAYVTGGQLAVAEAALDGHQVLSFLLNKLISGAAAVLLACLLDRHPAEESEAAEAA